MQRTGYFAVSTKIGRQIGKVKVAVLTSAFFGILSGSPISNVVSSGSITIPAMKKSGYDAVY